MNIGTSFQPGYQGIRRGYYRKQYHPYLYRSGQRRYAGKGRLAFLTATKALDYARRWAMRVERFMESQEVQHVD